MRGDVPASSELPRIVRASRQGDAVAGFLMGFAAYTPMEIEIAVRKLVPAFRAIAKPQRQFEHGMLSSQPERRSASLDI